MPEGRVSMSLYEAICTVVTKRKFLQTLKEIHWYKMDFFHGCNSDPVLGQNFFHF